MSKFQLEDCIAYLANKNANELSLVLDARLRKVDVSRTQWMALYFIDKAKDITQRKLAEDMGTSEASIVRLVDRLERDELVERHRSKENRREIHLVLTKKGTKINQKGTKIAQAFKDEAIKGISQKDLATFQNILNKMVENTKKQ